MKLLSKKNGSGCVQLGVECYGGGLWNTWFILLYLYNVWNQEPHSQFPHHRFDCNIGISGRVLICATNPVTQEELIEQHFIVFVDLWHVSQL